MSIDPDELVKARRRRGGQYDQWKQYTDSLDAKTSKTNDKSTLNTKKADETIAALVKKS